MPELASVLGEYERHVLRFDGRFMGYNPNCLHASRYIIKKCHPPLGKNITTMGVQG